MLVIIFGIPDIFIRYFLNFFYGPPLLLPCTVRCVGAATTKVIWPMALISEQAKQQNTKPIPQKAPGSLKPIAGVIGAHSAPCSSAPKPTSQRRQDGA